MRLLALVSSMVVMTTLTSSAIAKRPYRNNFRTVSYNSYQANSHEMTVSERLIYERALFRAQNRAARIQARKWAGISLSRPSLVVSPFKRVNNQNALWPWRTHRKATWSYNSIR